ncbi:DUF5811 family protein [Natronobacterium gregoryi]|uniref:Uncharacterized protein n=2 Tax=Natronobacterium gregoryi TaxID=44930 RepID=L0AJE3_NATGS|nr:DUF5811 family protein [Natronobacterium gregoryi]AFZ73155.1 hypothetical protein Natgr_1972 [Natronobacterium gregoryi SP2]ELY71120.1 hypothetical protein C490_05642 [Natronobacterium gregoryi SP2]PLK21565.1 hypothetical protein CYV19_03115 [Natronobacterium gregoryi SP2]SFI60001.1 hypothetical protein SAMN05443661_102109 [Natronobacterium gregoryi]
MNGNTPYAGLPGETAAGKRASVDVPDLSSTQRRLLHRDVTRIASRTREYLPSEYVVDADVSTGVGGPQVTVAVRPPIGHTVSAGFAPDLDDVSEEAITADERDEVARGLAASAALQVKQAIGDNVTPTAK